MQYKALIAKDGVNCIPVASIDNISINIINIGGMEVSGIYIKSGTQMVLYHKDLDPKKAKDKFIELVEKLYGDKQTDETILREDLEGE